MATVATGFRDELYSQVIDCLIFEVVMSSIKFQIILRDEFCSQIRGILTAMASLSHRPSVGTLRSEKPMTPRIGKEWCHRKGYLAVA